MSKKTFLPLAFCLVLLMAMSIGANAGGTGAEDLVKADWSLNAAHNLASNPPSLEAVQDFYDRATGVDAPLVRVCEFRFADLRNSGNLSLIVSATPEWSQECDLLGIYDRTPTGFEVYRGGGDAQDLAHSVLDLNHDGRHELLLWADLALYSKWSHFHYGLSCGAKWPLIFAWTGKSYSDVSDHYKEYYRGHLQSVNAQLAEYSSVLALAAAPTTNPAPEIGGTAEQAHGELSSNAGGEGLGSMGRVSVTPAPPAPEGVIPAWAARNEAHRNYLCTEIEAAKTEAFLGIHSDSTMSAAIKDSESDDPNRRIAAAVVFSYLGTQEAEQDLKALSSDADPRVAALAKRAVSLGEDPPPGAGMRREDTILN
jgi:hypothetical protein